MIIPSALVTYLHDAIEPSVVVWRAERGAAGHTDKSGVEFENEACKKKIPARRSFSGRRVSTEKPHHCRLTGRTHLRDAGHVRLVVELRPVVVDVLHCDDELGLRLLGLAGVPVDGLRLQDVEGLLLAVQPLQHADVAVPLVNLKQVAGAFPRQHVLDGAVAPVRVRLELCARETREKGRRKTCGF